jgi:hypothetical protein
MKDKRRKDKDRTEPIVGDDPGVEFEILLGLGSGNAELMLADGARCLDINPWLLDCVAVKVHCLGHQDELPRSWDWENVLTLLEPGEELLYVLDHVGSDGDQTGQSFTLWLAIRFPRMAGVGAGSLERRRQRARVLVSQFQRQAFPGSEISWVDPGDVHALMDFVPGGRPRCVCVSGMPSPRGMQDDRSELDRAQASSRNYQSLNDIAESLVDLRCDYRVALVVKRVDDRELRESLGWATDTRDVIHPLTKQTREESASAAANWSEQKSKTTGGNRSKQTTSGKQSGWGFLYSRTKNSSSSTTDGRNWSRTTGSTTGGSLTVSGGRSREEVRSLLEVAERSVERTIDALHEAHGTGGYRWAAFVLADGDSADIISGAVEGVLAGSRTKDHPLNRFEVRGAGPEIFQSSMPLLDLVAEAAPILPLPRVCDALLLPEAELPGLQLRRNVFLGRTCSPPAGSSRTTVRLGPDAFSSIGGATDPAYVQIPDSDLFRHVLVAGTTGSGKTTRVVEILNGLQDDTLSVVVFETAKRTYRHRVQRPGRPAPLVYTLGGGAEHIGSRIRPLRVNPFFFELGTSLKRHIAVLSDALAELMPTEAMIGPLMRRAVEAAYKERGWDIERGRPVREENGLNWPTALDFVAQVRTLAQTLNYGPEVTANYRGALENRAALFVDAAFEGIFSHGGSIAIDDLFPPGRDVIIEVDHLPPSEVDVRAFVMTLLLNRLRATQAVRHDQRGAHTPANDASTIVEAHRTANDENTPMRRLTHVLEECLPPRGSKKTRRKHRARVLREGRVMVSGVAANNRTVIGPCDRVTVDGRLVWPASTPDPDTSKDAEPTRDQIWNGSRRWLVVVEEAHNVLERSFEERRPADESNAGRTLLRCINRLLQEGREIELGLMVVDQSPLSLARSVISNTGTKVVMRLEDGAEMEEIGRAMGLDSKAWQKLGYLQEGEAVVKASYMDTPVKTAPFPELSDGPEDGATPPDRGWIPSYVEMESWWLPVLRGTKVPTEQWRDQLLTLAGGSAELAGFVGLKLLLGNLRNDPQAATKSAIFRSQVSRRDVDAEMLLHAAKTAYRKAVADLNSAALLGVERLLFRALARVPCPERKALVPVVALGIARAAEILEMEGLGRAQAWRSYLARLAGGMSSSWARTILELETYARETGAGDQTACLRVLTLVRAQATEHLASSAVAGSTVDPVDLLLQVHRLVGPIIECSANDVHEDEVEHTKAAVGEHLHRQLCLDLARSRGDDHASEIANLLGLVEHA